MNKDRTQQSIIFSSCQLVVDKPTWNGTKLYLRKEPSFSKLTYVFRSKDMVIAEVTVCCVFFVDLDEARQSLNQFSNVIV
jgi:hypothetical protein